MKSRILRSSSLLALLFASSSVFAADLPRRAEPPIFTPVPVYSWTGLYVGVNASGVVGGDFSATLVDPAVLAGLKGTASAAGYVAGGTFGYNYQFTPGSGIVVGIEGDVGYADIHNKLSIGVPGFGSVSASVLTDSYFATARGRLGYAWDRFLVYGTGGYAATEIGVRLDGAGLGLGSFSTKTSIDGYTVGGGIEYAITNSISVKGEYLYSEFKKPISFNIGALPVRFRAGLETQQLKLGINYKFNLFN